MQAQVKHKFVNTNMTDKRKLEIEFLKESNAIEGVYDDLALMQATFAWDWLKQQKKMTNHVVLKTHKILMIHQPILGYQRGYFRTEQVWVGGREGMQHEKIYDAVKHWCMNVQDLIKNAQNESEIFKDRLPKEQHVEYEKIHPFIDGNGRTGRMFLNWTRLKLKMPVLVIHRGPEQMEYYQWFK